MKAITLTQPWAALVAHDLKRYETRGWSTPYRGPLAIHAGKGFPRDCKELCVGNPPFSTVLHAAGYANLRALMAECGHVIAVAELVDVTRVQGTVPDMSWLGFPEWPKPAEHEASFGDYTAGRFAWALTNVRRLSTPIAAKGMLGLWPLPDDVQEAVTQQLATRH